MSYIRQFDHVGITVADLDSATAFFGGLGLEVEGRARSWRASSSTRSSASRTRGRRSSRCGRPAEAPGSNSRASSGPTTSLDRPPRWPTSWVCEASASRSSQAAVDSLAADGYGLVGGIGQHENTWRMAHVRGPEGIVVSLAERID